MVSSAHSEHLAAISNFQMPAVEAYLGEAVSELTEFKDRVQVLIDTCSEIKSKEIAVSASEFTSVAKILEKLLTGT